MIRFFGFKTQPRWYWFVTAIWWATLPAWAWVSCRYFYPGETLGARFGECGFYFVMWFFVWLIFALLSRP